MALENMLMALRPNLVFVFTDQQNSQVLGCENSELKTPAMDAIAAAGTRFSNAYCTQPLCSPARASMFSGVMPHQCGVTRNGQVFAESVKAHEMGTVFSQAGYECAYAGK